MKMEIGLKGYFTDNAGLTQRRQRAEVVHVWSDTCVNLRCEDGSTPTSVLIKQPGCAGYFFEPDQVDATEQLIREKGANVAPRVTKDDIDAEIVEEVYFTAEQGYQAVMREKHPDLAANGNGFPYGTLKVLTFCVLILRNGFTVTGESACASLENFNAEVGRTIARKNAVEKIWPLKGYELRTKLAAG